MTISGSVQQETILLVKLNTILDYTANVGTLTAGQFVVFCLREQAPPAAERVYVTVYANHGLSRRMLLRRALLPRSKYIDKYLKKWYEGTYLD